MDKKIIQIKCKGTNSININQLKDFQGNLKELRESEYNKLKNSIIKNGFRIPVFVWNNNLLDGHQRIFTIKKMCENGYELKEKIPVIEIEAKDKKEAKELLLLINSRYAKITNEGLYEYLETNELNFDNLKLELDLPEIDLDDFNANFYDEKSEEIEEDLIPYKKTHILLSFSPEKFPEIKEILSNILEIEGIEYEQSSN